MRGSDDRRTALRSAICDGDGRRVVVALSKGLRGDLLQLAGDGLLLALAEGAVGAPDLARRCAEQLRGRAWAGDDDLADQLDAALSDRPAPMLRPLPVDLEELAGILEGDPAHGGGRIDLRTGEVWPQAAIDYAREEGEVDPDDDDPDHWLAVWCEGSQTAYGDMEDFIEALSDRDRADRLSIVISGRGAFRRFKDVLGRWPDELEAWYAFSDERQRGRARAWLGAAGYSPRPAGRPMTKVTHRSGFCYGRSPLPRELATWAYPGYDRYVGGSGGTTARCRAPGGWVGDPDLGRAVGSRWLGERPGAVGTVG